MASRRFLHKIYLQEFCVTKRAIGMRWTTLFKTSRRTVVNRAVDTMIVNTTVMLMYVLLQCGTDAACLNRNLVTLRAQTLPRIKLITTVHGTSMSRSD